MNNPLSIVLVVLAVMVAIPCPDKAIIDRLQTDISAKDKELKQVRDQVLKDAKNALESAKKNCIP